MTLTPMASKEKQRQEAQERRVHFLASLTHDTRTDLAHDMAARFCATCPPSSTMKLAAYWPLTHEADPRFLLQSLSQQGVPLALPRAQKNRPLTFHTWSLSSPLVRGPFGPQEPLETAPELAPLTHLLIPLLAFDRKRHRLGYGQGHYDRTLARLVSHRPRPLFVGFAFACQEVDTVIIDSYDQALDIIVTERDVIES